MPALPEFDEPCPFVALVLPEAAEAPLGAALAPGVEAEEELDAFSPPPELPWPPEPAPSGDGVGFEAPDCPGLGPFELEFVLAPALSLAGWLLLPPEALPLPAKALTKSLAEAK